MNKIKSSIPSTAMLPYLISELADLELKFRPIHYWPQLEPKFRVFHEGALQYLLIRRPIFTIINLLTPPQ